MVHNVKVLEWSLDQAMGIWLGIQFRQRNSQIKDRKPKKNCGIFLAWQDPETQRV